MWVNLRTQNDFSDDVMADIPVFYQFIGSQGMPLLGTILSSLVVVIPLPKQLSHF